MTPVTMYVDSSVIGGYFDDEFADMTRPFFDHVRDGRIIVLISEFVTRELGPAPENVKALLRALPKDTPVELEVTAAALRLRDAYLNARILGHSSIVDATHVALATVARADAIVSWNFKHIVRIDKMRAFNATNLSEGFGLLSIVSRNEVRFDDDS